MKPVWATRFEARPARAPYTHTRSAQSDGFPFMNPQPHTLPAAKATP